MDILKRLQIMESEYSRIEKQAKQQLETVRSAIKLVMEEERRARTANHADALFRAAIKQLERLAAH